MVQENQYFPSTFLFSAKEYFHIYQYYLLRMFFLQPPFKSPVHFFFLTPYYRYKEIPAHKQAFWQNKKNPLKQGFSVDHYTLISPATPG